MNPLVPLIQHLTNAQFVTTLDKLVKATFEYEQAKLTDVCRCGCGEQVVIPRQFVNQWHYNDCRHRKKRNRSVR